MRRSNLHRLTLVAALVLLGAAAALGASVHVMTIKGPIGPVTAMQIENALEAAVAEDAEALIVQMDTPGGLVSTTHEITQQILNANVPVVTYVAPSGASATSAGVFILISGHIAAMAPGTNAGAAHPVTLQGEMDSVMSGKATNDAAANIKAIAQRRGRNAAWAERAVRESVSITSHEAVDSNIVDLIADDLDDLIDSLHGRVVMLPFGEDTLDTRGAAVVRIEPTWREKLLGLISNPNIAYILMSIGWIGILMELYNPGSIFPGVVGAIALILGFYSLQTLPINYAGLSLILVAIILFILELKIISHGLLTVGGAIAMIIGSVMLIDSPDPAAQISFTVILAVVGTVVAFFTFGLAMALKARLRRPVTGPEGLIGQIGTAREAFETTGMVYVGGEYWQAETQAPVAAGTRVEVVGKQGMKLIVKPIP
ncbi:MAG TPA: nodulation protein NfeD [bacterium]|nr:nodulation protein NfeD [bacterium]